MKSVEVQFVDAVFTQLRLEKIKRRKAQELVLLDDQKLTKFAEELPYYSQELWEEVLTKRNLLLLERPDIEKLKAALLNKAREILSTRSNT